MLFEEKIITLKDGRSAVLKSPDVEELYKVTIQKNFEAGVINAETLWKYYTGELIRESNFKEIIENFMTELINYSQEQEINISRITSKLEHRKGQENGI